MPIKVQAQGQMFEFPDGTSRDQIASALQRRFQEPEEKGLWDTVKDVASNAYDAASDVLGGVVGGNSAISGAVKAATPSKPQPLVRSDAPSTVDMGTSGVSLGLPANVAKAANDRGEQAAARADASLIPPEDSWSEIGRKFFDRIGPLVKQSVGGIGQALTETSGYVPFGTPMSTSEREDFQANIDEALKIARDQKMIPGQKLADAATADLRENAYNFGDNVWKEYPAKIAESVVQMIPTIAASVATRNPSVAGFVTAGQVGGSQYAESRETDRDRGAALFDAVTMGLAEAIGEKIPVGIIMRPGGKFLPKVLGAMGAESLQETFTQSIQSLYDKGVLHPEMTWGEVRDQIVDAAIVGAGMGGTFAVGFGAFDAATRRPGSNPAGEIERSSQIDLTPEDVASPLPNDLLAEGKGAMATGEAASRADEILAGIGMPKVGSDVRVENIPGQSGSIGGKIEDAFSDETGAGVVIRQDNGSVVRAYADDLADAGVTVRPVNADEINRMMEQDAQDAKARADAVMRDLTMPAPSAAPASTPQAAAAPPVASSPSATGGDAIQGFMDKTRRVESSGKDNAKNPNSSATGRYQFTDGTWLATYRAEFGNTGESADQILAKRGDGAMQDRLMKRLTTDNAKGLQAAGIEVTEASLYLAHFAGIGGARALIKADPNAPVEQVLGERAVAANPFLKGKSAREVVEWAATKMGGSAGASSSDAMVDSTTTPRDESDPYADALAQYQREQERQDALRAAEDTGPAMLPMSQQDRQAEPLPDLYHGGRAGMTADDIEIVREPGSTKQGKKNRVYGGFYATEKLDEAQGYAAMGEGSTVYKLNLKEGATVERKDGDVTRLSPKTIEEYRQRGVDIVVGKDPRGRTEYVVINKEAVQGLTDVNQQSAPAVSNVRGPAIDTEWTRFAPESGTLNVPRADMPQIKAEDRSSLVQFLKARGVSYEEQTVPAASLKPTQAEFSEAKVQKAKEFEGGNRALLVSSDGYVVDGHHQWLAARDQGEDIRTIRLDAPIRDLLRIVPEMPSVTNADGSTDTKPVEVPSAKTGGFRENSAAVESGDVVGFEAPDGRLEITRVGKDAYTVDRGSTEQTFTREQVEKIATDEGWSISNRTKSEAQAAAREEGRARWQAAQNTNGPQDGGVAATVEAPQAVGPDANAASNAVSADGVATPASTARIEDTPTGKGIAVIGASEAELAAIAQAVPKAKPTPPRKSDGAVTYSKKYEAEIRAALESAAPAAAPTARVTETVTPKPAAGQTFNAPTRSLTEPERAALKTRLESMGPDAATMTSSGFRINAMLERNGPADKRDGEYLAEAMKAALATPRAPITARAEPQADVAVTATGTEVPVNYAVVEMADLVASNTPDGGVNPAYPADRQPRDRTRAASQTQIAEIASRLNPRLLGRSPKASDGAPIISPDGIVESGNGRTLALQRVYAENGANAQAYREFIQSEGFDTTGMRQPVLVRIRDGQMSTEQVQDFVRAANVRDTAGMSGTETAGSDASAMPAQMVDLYRGGDIEAAGNREFVKAFVNALVPTNERASMILADGSIAKPLVARMEAAMLVRAFGQRPFVEKMVDATDSNIRAIGKALVETAGKFAKLREAAQDGRVDPAMDITGNIADAVEIIDRARREGKPIGDYVNQRDIFSGSTVEPRTESVLRSFFFGRPDFTKPLGQARMVVAMDLYVEEAMKAAPGGGLFGESTKATPDGILDLAYERRNRTAAQDGDLFAATRPRDDANGARDAAPSRNDERPAGEVVQARTSSESGSSSEPVSTRPARQSVEAVRNGDVYEVSGNDAEAVGGILEIETEERDGNTIVAIPAGSIEQARTDLDGAGYDLTLIDRGNRPSPASADTTDRGLALFSMPAGNLPVIPAQEAEWGSLPGPGRTRLEILRGRVERWYDSLIGTSIQSSDGKEVKFNRRGEKKTLRAGEDLLLMARAIPEIIKQGALIASEASTRPGISAVHRYAANVQMRNGEARNLMVIVRETTSGTFHYSLHNLMEEPRDNSAGANREAKEAFAPALEGIARDNLNLTDADAAIKQLNSSDNEDVRAALREQLASLRLADKVKLKIVDTLGGAAGEYRAQLVTIATDTAQGEVFTLNHEAIHALRDLGLFNTSEWTILSAKAKRETGLMRSIRQRYEAGFRQRGMTGAAMEEALIEEAVADMFARHQDGRYKAEGTTDRLFKMLRQFFEAVRNAFAGRGLRTAEGVMQDVAAGEVGGRNGQGMLDGSARQSVPERDDLVALGGSDPSWRGKVAKAYEDWRMALQDRYLPVLKAQREIERVTGKALPDSRNPYMGEELMSGRIGERLDRLAEDHVEPLFDAMHAEGVTMDELETFALARHAPERNARIAEINPEFADGEGSGMTDIQAAAIMNRVRKSGKMEAMERLAARLDAIREMTLDYQVQYGLISQAQADEMRATYEFYIPLRGFAEVEDGDPAMADRINRSGGGINVRGKESKAAFGRRSKADSPVAYLIMQAESAIVRGETNRVAQRFVNLAKSNPDEDFWEINKVTQKKRINPDTGLVERYIDRNLQSKDADYTVSAKFNGVERRVTMNAANPAARKMADAMRNLTQHELDWFSLHVGKVNRFLSAVNTTWNPEFVITNAFRDMQTAALNLSGEQMQGLVKGVAKDYRKAWLAATKGAFGRRDGEWGKWFTEFRANGGAVSFNKIDNINEVKERLSKIAKTVEAKNGPAMTAMNAKRFLLAFRDMVESVNSGVENAVRLATYKNAREMGLSPDKAASLAKNVTVNFNRRGTMGPAINSFYMFFNASIQGSTRILMAMRSPKVRKMLAGVMVASFATELLNAFLSDDDGDGESFYDKIPAYEKSRNIILMIGGSDYIKFPTPWGYNVFWNAGRAMSEIGRRGGDRWQETMAQLATDMVDAFNPIGGSDSLLKLISPTISDPIVELTLNADFTGKQIMPEAKFGPEDPDNQRYWGNVGPHWKAIAGFLSDITGGDKVQGGAIDISPETMEYLFGTAVGSAGALVDRTFSMFTKWRDPDVDVTANDIPLWRKIKGEKSSWYDKSKFYDRLAQVESTIDNAKDYIELGEMDGAREFIDHNAKIVGMEGFAKEARAEMRKIRKARSENELLYEREQIDAETYRSNKTRVKEAENDLVRAFNTAWNDRVANGE